MDLSLYDLDFNRLGVVDTASSIIWHRQYTTAGSFEILVPAINYYISLLQRGRIVCRQDAAESGIIDTIQIKQDESGATITATGRMLSGILGQRVIEAPVNLNTTAEQAMRRLVESNAVSPADAGRIIPNLLLGNLQGLDIPLEAYIRRQNLLECLNKISQVSTLGFRVRMDIPAKKYVFEVYNGLNRSASQSANPRAIFSEDTDTLTGMSYSATNTGIVNAVIAKSVDLTITEGGGQTGFARYEKIVEVDPVTYTIENSEGDSYTYVDIAQTQAAMRSAADEQLAAPEPESFEGDVLTGTNSLIYRKGYDLGDIVTVRSTRYGLSAHVRITAIDEVYDENGTQIVPTFGSPLPSLIDIFKE